MPGPFTHGTDHFPNATRASDQTTAQAYGTKPFRTVIDFTDTGVEQVNTITRQVQENYLSRMGFGELLKLKR